MSKLGQVFFLCALLARAVDGFSGKWSGSMTTTMTGPQEVPVVLVLKQDKSSVTGTISESGGEPAVIQDAKLNGNNITFKLSGAALCPSGCANDTMLFDGTLGKDRLKFNVQVSGTVEFAATMLLKRD